MTTAIATSAAIPSSRGQIPSFTFLTAWSTPLPRNGFWSPSRSSTASCSPVDAPLGTAARPAAPLASVTSASMVGLPRLSRISRACTEMMVLMVAPTLAGAVPRVNARPEREQGGAGALGEPLPVVEGQALGGNRLADQDPDRPRVQPHPALGQDLEAVVHVHGNDRHAGGDRQTERRIFERQQLAGAAAGAFRKHHGRDTAPDHRGRPLIRLERPGPIEAVDGDVTGGEHRTTHQTDHHELLPCDET